MNFFKYFDTQNYSAKEATNILSSVLLKFKNVNNTTLYFYHSVADGETPESIAFDMYGNSDLHWTILLLNHTVDPYFMWPLNKRQLQSYSDNKYDNPNDIHHFIYEGRNLYPNQSFKIDGGGYISFNELYDNYKNGDPILQNVFIVTNIDFEFTANNNNRDIKVLNRNIIDRFVDQFTNLLAGRISNATI